MNKQTNNQDHDSAIVGAMPDAGQPRQGFKGTPGPWRACEPGSNFSKGKKFIRPINSEKTIATISAEYRFSETAANAHLIAAAPDLYEALQIARECITYCRRVHKDAQSGEGFQVEIFIDAAIAKAEGRAP